MMTFHTIAGVTAGALSLAAYLLYNWTIIKGRTKPNRATWWILTLVGVLILWSYYQSGARESIWVPVAYVVGPLLIALLSIRYGEGGWSRFDRFCLAGALVSCIFLFFLKDPLVTLLINIFIDFLGLLPTVKKSYLRPAGEDKTAWVMEFSSSMINLLAVTSWTFAIAVYPLYLAIMNGLIAIVLIIGKRLK